MATDAVCQAYLRPVVAINYVAAYAYSTGANAFFCSNFSVIRAIAPRRQGYPQVALLKGVWQHLHNAPQINHFAEAFDLEHIACNFWL